MADEADVTADRDEREAPARLAASRRDPGEPANGRCHWCSDPVAPLVRYCDDECKSDYERQLRGRGLRA